MFVQCADRQMDGRGRCFALRVPPSVREREFFLGYQFSLLRPFPDRIFHLDRPPESVITCTWHFKPKRGIERELLFAMPITVIRTKCI